MSNLDWLWFAGSNNADNENSDPYAPEVLKKLAKHNYALVLNRMETGKIQTVQLCVHDALIQYENPNIVIICPEHLLKSWYSTLLWEMGAEFKYFGVYEKSANLFSGMLANLCLVSSESITRDKENSVLGNPETIWDLMIIDIPVDDKTELKTYIDYVKSQAKKLLISAPASARYGAEYENMTELVKALLHRKRKDDTSEEIKIKVPVNGNSGNPFVTGRNMTGDYEVKTISYKIDPKSVEKAVRAEGASRYKFGGNIFEEYALEERIFYRADEYTNKHLKELVTIDTKMKAFLNEINIILEENPENCAVVYCSAPNTVNYIAKALRARYGDKKNICVYNVMTDADYINSELYCNEAAKPRVIITDDRAGVKFLNAEKITHIINYEYPENPAVLEQRYTRSGRKPSKPVFYVFCDADYKYDGRMLRKTVLSKLGKAFCARIPDKCLLFNIENIEEYLITLILDLKYISDHPKEAGEDFSFEYGLPATVTGKAAAAEAEKMLKNLAALFDLGSLTDKKNIDGEKLFNEITKKITEFKGKRIYLEGNALRVEKESSRPLPEQKIPQEVAAAAEFTAKLTGGAEDLKLIKAEMAKLSDGRRLSALLALWKHYRYKMNFTQPYKKFIGIFNNLIIKE